MALTEPTTGRIIEFIALEAKVTLARACKRGDVLAVAEDNFDDMGPGYSASNAHVTDITYLPRFIAGQDGAANDVITAYGAAYVTGYSSAVAYSKVYMAQTSGTAGQISETLPTGTASCGSVIGMSLATNRVYLHPGFDAPPDTTTSA